MAERRFPLTIRDHAGARHDGELIVVSRWEPSLSRSPDAAFAIVLSEAPLAPDTAPPRAERLAVCAPSRRVRLEKAIGEGQGDYGAGQDDADGPPLRLPPATAAAFAQGSILASTPLSVYPSQVFAEGEGHPRFELLAEALVEAMPEERRLLAYWRAADGVLCWPDDAPRSPQPSNVRIRLRKLLAALRRKGGEDLFQPAIERLRRVAEGELPTAMHASPAALADDVALARCIAERPDEAARLAGMRAYIEGVRIPAPARELSVDRAVVREQLSFGLLLAEPERLDGARAAFESFRSAYASGYVDHHAKYWQARGRLHQALTEVRPVAHALGRLNSLRELGAPEGLLDLVEYERMGREPAGCAVRNLERMLADRPTCQRCGLTLEDVAATERAQQVASAIEQALRRQQRRLASRAVRRILARGGERIEQFLQIVQASDLRGLADVLDDELLLFLRDLLAQELAATRPAAEPVERDLLLELVQAHPVVTEEQIEAVTNTFRELLEEALRAERERANGHPARVQLTHPASTGNS